MPFVSCTCQGERPNCSRCHGLGEIRVNAAHFTDKDEPFSKIQNAIALFAGIPQRNPPTPECRRVSKAASSVMGPFSIHNNLDPYDYYVIGRGFKCPKCRERFVSPSDFRHHKPCMPQSNLLVRSPITISKKIALRLPATNHSNRTKSLNIQFTRKPQATAHMFLQQCDHCPSKVRSDRLQKHIARCHRARAGFKKGDPMDSLPQGDISRFAVSQMLLEAELKRATKNVRTAETSMDGSSKYSGYYRESGKFGSHPGHDRYDDESGAD
jgi:hypothetical protein